MSGFLLRAGVEDRSHGTQRIVPVSAEVWAVKIDGAQVLELWLRNHRGRMLGRDDARDITMIVGSLAAAERLQPDIEALVEDLLEGEIVRA